MPGNLGMLYQKKDCNGCKAIHGGKCLLGFKNLFERPDRYNSAINYYIPTEPCSKPRTIAALLHELDVRSIPRPAFLA